MSRAVHIYGVEYPYKIHSAGMVVRLPTGKSIYVSMEKLIGWDSNALERARWKRYLPPVKPSDVKRWMIDNLPSLQVTK